MPNDTTWQRRLRIATGPGVSLHVAEAGDGPPLLLLHGFPDNGDLWRPMVAQLAGRHRVWAPDLRGFRFSDKPEGTAAYTVAHLLQDVLALAGAMSPDEPVCIAGHDWGGMLAWGFAACHPARVRRLAVANAPHPARFAQLLRSDARQRQASAYITALSAPGAHAALSADGFARLRALLDGPDSPCPPEELDAALQGWQVTGALQAMLNWYRALGSPAELAEATLTFPTLPSVDGTVPAPTLLLWGERDQAFVPGNLVGLERWVPRLRIERFAQAGHWLPREQPQAMAAALLAFFAEHDA
jgi:pimeloyl-ACP methyl ester carboxylesterase